MKTSTPAFSFGILWMSFCALFNGWKQAHHLSPFAFYGWASVPICLDEEKHTRFLFFHFMDEHLCPILWMKKCNPASNFPFYEMNICTWLYGWKTTIFLILHFMDEHLYPFVGWKQSNQLFHFAFYRWASVPDFMDEKNPTRFLILHFLDECLYVFVGWKQANRLFHFAFNGGVSRYLILWM